MKFDLRLNQLLLVPENCLARRVKIYYLIINKISNPYKDHPLNTGGKEMCDHHFAADEEPNFAESEESY